MPFPQKRTLPIRTGAVILEAGTVIEEKATGEDGMLTFEGGSAHWIFLYRQRDFTGSGICYDR